MKFRWTNLVAVVMWALTGVAVVIILLQLRQISRAIAPLQAAVQETDDRVLSLQQAILQLADDMNETRSILGLPASEYQILPPSLDDESTQSPYFLAIDKLLSQIEENNAIDAISALRENPRFQAALEGSALSIGSNPKSMLFLMTRDQKIATFQGRADAGYELQITNTPPRSFPSLESLVAALPEIFASISGQVEVINQLQQEFRSFLASADLQALLEKKNLRMGNVEARELWLRAPLFLAMDQVAVLEMQAAPLEYRIDGRSFADFPSLQEELRSFISTTTFLSQEEERWQQAVAQFRQSLQDPGLKEYLRLHDLELSETSRDDGEHLYFDLLSLSEGSKMGSFALQRRSLQLWIFDADEVPLTSLQTLLISDHSPNPSPSLPLTSMNEETTVFLISGVRENLTDTMIMAFANPHDQTLQFVSIPRDLFYKGRKINQLYNRYGVKRFIAELEKITGVQIQHHIFIDMYAFIEVIDMLGGIDITLEEALIDPSYKIRVGNNWSTLYYPAGSYHLNGVETLRVVRSRHTTDDFDRATRQQKILMAIREEMKEIGLIDLGKLYNLIQIVSKYVTTDLNPFQIINYLSHYENLKIQSQGVLSTDNVLYTTYSNLYYTGKSVDEIDPLTFDKGSWILLPKEDDWSRIQGFFQKVVKS